MSRTSAFIIVWRNINITVDCIESVLENSKQHDIEYTIVNPNDHLPESGTNQIRDYLRSLVSSGRIKRALLYEENCFGHGLVNAIKLFPPKSEFFILSDGDMLAPAGSDWFGLCKKYHEDKNLMITGFQLSLDNYKAPNYGFDTDANEFGIWMQAIKTDWYLNTWGLEANCIDSQMLASTGGRYKKIREIEMMHLTWSIFFPESKYYDPHYADYKRQVSSSFAFRGRPTNMNFELVQNERNM